MLPKFGALIAWNLALLALVLGVPLLALWHGGWLALAFMVGLAAVYALLRRPAFLLGMWLGGS